MVNRKERLSILMLGESLERPGGVVTVEMATLASAPDQLAFHHIATLPADGPFRQLRKLLTLIGAAIALACGLCISAVDVVHIHVSMGASVYRKCLLAWIAFLFGKPVVMHTHGGEFAKQYPTMPGWLQRIVGATFRRCAAVITLAETWRRFYIETLGIKPERALILKNPVNLPKSLPERSSASPIRFLYLGMLSEPKGAFDLIDAMTQLDDTERRRLHLTIAGHGKIDEARAKVIAHGLEDIVTVRGWLNAEERDALLAETHVFALPSHFEGLPMALLEAMSFGIAPIATPVGGIPDVLTDGENGLLVPPGDHQAIAAAIRRVLDDDALRSRLGAAARASVEPYSADGYAEALVDIYASMTSDRALQDVRPEMRA
jgi:glycosyltransferase involved in cell wall biosynthesis